MFISSVDRAATACTARPRDTERLVSMQSQLTISPLFGDPRLPARFWAKVRIGPVPAYRPDLGPCWEWQAALRKGYGAFSVGNRRDGNVRMATAHVVAYEVLIGLIPEGLESDHLCRNRACVNCSHIEPVTGGENRRRGDHYERRRTHCPQGHPYSGTNLIRRRGRRFCRACNIEHHRSYGRHVSRSR